MKGLLPDEASSLNAGEIRLFAVLMDRRSCGRVVGGKNFQRANY